MALNTSKCNHLPPLPFKWLIDLNHIQLPYVLFLRFRIYLHIITKK